MRIWTDRANGSTDLSDMAFVSPNLAKHDIQFRIGDDLGSDHLSIEISIDATPHKNSYTNHTKYKFHQTDREVFESTLEAALGSEDFSGLMSTSDLDKYADFIVSAISTAVDRAIPKSKSVRTESNPISDETLALIKDKRRLRRQHLSMLGIVSHAYQSWFIISLFSIETELLVYENNAACISAPSFISRGGGATPNGDPVYMCPPRVIKSRKFCPGYM